MYLAEIRGSRRRRCARMGCLARDLWASRELLRVHVWVAGRPSGQRLWVRLSADLTVVQGDGVTPIGRQRRHWCSGGGRRGAD